MSIQLTMPRLSDTMETGTIIKWNVKEGDKVSSGQAIADVETDKATMEMQAYDDGVIARILVKEGQSVEVGTPIAVLAEKGEDPAGVSSGNGAAASGASAKAQTARSRDGREVSGEADRSRAGTATASKASGVDGGRRSTSVAARPAGTVVSAAPRADLATSDGRMRVSPVARHLADEHGIDLQSIQGSGPGGRVIKRDVLQAIETGRETAAAIPPSAAARVPAMSGPSALAVSPSPVADPEDTFRPGIVPMSSMRQTIARRLVESKSTIPHYQVTVRFNMDPLLDLRQTLNQQLEGQSVKLSVNDFLVRACALAIHRHPEFNASWGDDHIEIHAEVNVGVAISLPAERGGGLVVGTIRHADMKSLRQISADTRRLADKARSRGLTIDEMAGSTFTISNLGMYGVEHFTAIINPPNSAILAVGAALEQPVVRGGQLTVGHEMSATLSLDHRVIDGATAAQFLQALKQLIEAPAALLV